MRRKAYAMQALYGSLLAAIVAAQYAHATGRKD